jgi:putative ABC transport system permease protein
MSSLYFGDELPELISMQAVEALAESDLALPIPLYVRFRARGFPIVGTTLDYLDFRQLRIARGRPFGILGECVIGANVAKKLALEPGDSLISSPETLFDLAGVYPLKMRVAGILDPAHDADDLAILVDIKTAWTIEGLGHGHEDITRTTDESVILERTESSVIANAKLMQYTEITEENVEGFHFHGNPAEYPLTAVIVLPRDEKSGTILRGRYLTEASLHQIVRPRDVVDTLMANIFRIKSVLDAVVLVVGVATFLALALVFALSLRLRQREINTIFKLGCSRATTARLLGAEMLILIAMSGAICTALLVLIAHYDQTLVRELLL